VVVEPYYVDDSVTLYLGDCREVLPTLRPVVDCVVADPPYGETALAWDRWPDGWLAVVGEASSSMWCFGSMRMFLHHRDEFGAWSLSQDVVWEKHNGSGFAADRFKRVHETVTHWYRGEWRSIYKDVPRELAGRRGGGDEPRGGVDRLQHTGEVGTSNYVSGAQAMRLVRSVIRCRSMHRRAIHQTEKPIGILDLLIRYACPPGGVVLDPFAGSGSTAEAARLSGRRAVLIEADEGYCQKIVRRLAADVLPIGGG
jgi:site-specific DNA-methyltransferase (adenine-specific)